MGSAHLPPLSSCNNDGVLHLCLQITALPLLAPFSARVDALAEQLGVCLEAFAAVIDGREPPERCAALATRAGIGVPALHLATPP